MALERETAVYERLLSSELAGQEGRYAAISGDRLIGVFDSYNDALTAGYSAAGLDPLLVKQVSAFPVVANFTRDLRPCTPAPI